MKNIIIAALIILPLSGCASYNSAPSANNSVQIVEDAAVKGCQSLGEVTGSSMFASMWGGRDIAKDEIKDRAAKLGATHVVIDYMSPHLGIADGGSTVRARAYKCK